MIKKYRKKPVIIEAIQLKGDSKTIKECLEFMGQSVNEDLTIERNKFEDYCFIVNEKGMKIPTLEGEMTASINDYIIKGIKGEFYPCKPDIFEQTYEQADNKNGIDLIRLERKRQIEIEGFDEKHDSRNLPNELAIAASCYCLPHGQREFRVRDQWPFTYEFWKPTPEDRVKELTKAGALIAAEIDRSLNIEQAAREYGNIDKNLIIDTEERYYKNFQKYDGFKAGVNFAQKWTYIEEELPEYYQRILADNGEYMSVAARVSDGDEDLYTIHGTDFYMNPNPIRWKLIELK